ncbi:MAG: late competence development ComFB family protein [Oscillospiraceae bacterium]|nr:late competence development ComFB family protein [Oscillospiraceae bacterium]
MLDASAVHNVTKELVFSQLELMKPHLPSCTCDRCCLDIAAIALNHLNQKYVVTREGELFSKLDASSPQQMADVAAAIMSAAVLVSQHPRHS